MFLVELVMQGVRGFQQVTRLRFQGGFNFIAAGSESGKTTTVDTAVQLLFPRNEPAKLEAFHSRLSPDASRGALVVYSDDGSYYQVIEDFSKRAINLSRHDPATKKFTLLHKDWNAAAQFMTGLLPSLSAEDYNRLCVYRRESCWGQSTASTAAAAVERPRAAAPARGEGQNPRLAELHETLRRAEEAADAEYKADAARMRLNEIAKKLERIEEGRAGTAQIEAQLAELQSCETLPQNLAELIGAHEQEQSQKLVRTDELDRDIEGLTAQRDGMPQPNFLTERLFLAGVAVAVLAFVAGVFLLSEEQSHFFPIGVLAGALLAAAGWYNSSRKSIQRKAFQKEIDTLVKERAEVEKKFQDSGATIVKYMQATGSASAVELKDKADTYKRLREHLADLQEQQKLSLDNQAEEDIQASYDTQRQEVEKLEQAAKALAHFNVDTYGIRQEIERLEADHATHPAVGFTEMAMGGISMPLPAETAGSMNVLAEIAVASRISGIEMETLVPAVESAAQRNLSSVSAGRYGKVELSPDGRPVVHDRTGARIAYNSLSHSTRELVSFCLRAGLIESIAGKRRLPFLLDDPFTGMDQARQMAVCSVLRQLGTRIQVILLTANSALRAPGDAASELK